MKVLLVTCFVLVLITLFGCHKTYDCNCTTDKGQVIKVGTVSASKKKAKEICANNVSMISSGNFITFTIN
ncbi:MAG: hypothetical protein H0U95_18735 [Bacteroidetes bacterium]|nr:hypothetical protein [Bacteroidota bacterium]